MATEGRALDKAGGLMPDLEEQEGQAPLPPEASDPVAAPRRGLIPPPRRRGRISVTLAVGWLVLVALLAITASWLPIADHDTPVAGSLDRPALEIDEPLGTDLLGRSMLSRVVHGARVSLAVGFLSVALGMVVGGAIGVVAGYFRGKVEEVLNILTDTVLAFPPLILLLAMTVTLGSTLRNLVLALALLTTPTFARLARANTLVFARREFVLAARAMGAGHGRIMVREILPNVLLPVASYAFLIVAVVIVAEGSLSFLGLGIPPPNPSWGGMIAAAKDRLETEPYLVFVPAAVMFITVFAFNVVGDRARSRFDVRGSAL